MIKVEGVTKAYGLIKALDFISFDICAGESVALWGANGAGKTTAIRCLLGVHKFSGNLYIGGVDVQKDGKRARTLVGYVPQETAFFDMSVQETLTFYARLKKVSKSRIEEVLGLVQLSIHREKLVSALSGGMKQRLALGIALLSDPPIMLLDEPTASLDTRAQRDFVQIIRALNSDGKTIIFSSHRIEEVAALADRVLLLESGRLKADYTPSELASDLGLRQWMRIVLHRDHLDEARVKLEQGGYMVVPNGEAIYVRLREQQRLGVFRLLSDDAVLDFDIADVHEVPGSFDHV